MVPQPAPDKRPICPSCSKPTRTCLCTRLKTPILENSIAIAVLQHSLEKKHPLNTTRIATLGLKNINLAYVSDVHLEAQFYIHLLQSNLDLGLSNSTVNLQKTEPFESSAINVTIKKRGFIKDPNFNELLSSKAAIDRLRNGFTVKKMQIREEFEFEFEFEIEVPSGSVLLFPSENSIGIEEIDFEVKNLIVLDGTWAKATRMYEENPWLKVLPHLKLEMDNQSLYGEVRHQPRAGCLSSIESIVYGLKAVGEDLQGLDSLLDVFDSMVGDQRRCKIERLSKIGDHEI